METHKLINSSPNSSDQHPDPNDQSATHKVSFAFNHLKIDENEANKQQSLPESDETVDENGENDDEVSFNFNRLKIDEIEANKQQSVPESIETVNDEGENDDYDAIDDEDEEEGEFTFMCIGDDNDSPTSEVFENGQIRNRHAFPLFDQSLLLSPRNNDGERRRLPIHVPVDKVFIESPRRQSPSSSTVSGDKSTAAMLCALPNEAPEMNMKSNSTGFSKLWRFRDKMNRSNSDGRDAFVFLEPSNRTTTTSKTTSSSSISIGKSNGGDEFDSSEKVNGKAKAVKKAKKLTASAHEVYLKQRGEQTEDERRRRRSYLPYRPGLMGFFTNVNGGLSKNVHPF